MYICRSPASIHAALVQRTTELLLEVLITNMDRRPKVVIADEQVLMYKWLT